MSVRYVTADSPLNRRILQALRDDGPMHAYELAGIIGSTSKTVRSRDYLPMLHSSGLIHIARWLRVRDAYIHGEIEIRRGVPIPVYAIGAGHDAAKPAPHDHATNSRNQRARNPGRFRVASAKRNGLHVMDPILAALTRPLPNTEVHHG